MAEEWSTDKLFLMEIVVDTISALDSTSKDRFDISFTFLNNTVQVAEDNLPPKKNGNSTKSGKSCLFALSPELAAKMMDEFKISAVVSKTLKGGETVITGNAEIHITSLFNQISEALLNDPNDLPISKTLKKAYQIVKQDSNVGMMSIYLRISCFGKIIVTQFQRGGKESFLFKGEESNAIYQCKKFDAEIDPHVNETKSEQCEKLEPTIKHSRKDAALAKLRK